MATSSVIGTLRANLKTQLAAREGLSGVTINSFPPGEPHGGEAIYFADASASQDPFAMGGAREEIARLEIVCYSRQPGSGDTIAAATEDRALALWAQIEAQVRADDTVNSAVLEATIDDYTTEPGADAEHMTSTVRGNLAFRTPI